MIREFRVKNYLSIKDSQCLSFVTRSKDPSMTVGYGKERLSKLAILYGPNASGKSNMLFALENVFDLLYKPCQRQEDKVKTRKPFALTSQLPTTMEVSFYANGIRYDYEINYTLDVILNESLVYYPNGYKTGIYNRQFVGEGLPSRITFGQGLRLSAKEKGTLVDNTLNNHTVLSTLGKLNRMAQPEIMSALYDWIGSHVHQVEGDEQELSMVEYLKKVREDQDSYSFFKQMLDKADVNILDYEVREHTRQVSSEIRKRIENDPFIPEQVKSQMLSEKVEDIVFSHNSEAGRFEVSLADQSAGTLSFLAELKILYRLINGSHVYLLDEIEQNLHYELLLFYLSFFLINSEQSQLIFTSQELQLLSEDFIDANRQAVWFIEKDPDTVSSQYQRADSFGVHKNLSLYNAYRSGRIGCRPMLKSPLIEA